MQAAGGGSIINIGSVTGVRPSRLLPAYSVSKAALAMLGQIKEEYRLPLVKMSARNRKVLKNTMKAVGVLR